MLPVGARTTPLGNFGERASATGAMARARIERADFDARRFRAAGHWTFTWQMHKLRFMARMPWF